MKSSPPLSLPDVTPIMVLPGALLFPYSLLPLYLFEERYRQMLAWALENDRMFAVASEEAVRKTGPQGAIVGLGLVRACVENADGTSNLILQGVARVRLVEHLQHEPFYVTRISQPASEIENRVKADALAVKVLELCSGLDVGTKASETLQQHLRDLHDPEVLADMAANTFVQDEKHRQQLLEELNVPNRLRLLIRCLSEEYPGQAD